MEDLARSRGPRRQALYAKEAPVAPEQFREAFHPGTGADRAQEGF